MQTHTAAPSDPPLAHPSAHHLPGWVTDYEAVADVQGLKDVQHLGILMMGFNGRGFRTVKAAGLADHPEVRFLPNDEWTEVVSGADWPAVRAYLVSLVTEVGEV